MTMKETLSNRLFKLTNDVHVEQVDVAYKCKTKDGMIYTLDIDGYRRDAIEGYNITFPEHVDSCVIKELLNYLELVEAEDGFYFSSCESVLIRKSEIVRVWADIECGHFDEGAKII